MFVEYTFDATHEFVSDLIEFNRSVTWIVYVVTKVSIFAQQFLKLFK